jgi:hypothetical protein
VTATALQPGGRVGAPSRSVSCWQATLLLAAILGETSAAATPPTPQIVFVPSPHAYALTKHPTLPALYVGCSAAPESKNLITFRLDGEGKLIADSRRDWPDWFTTDGKNPDFLYTILRPAVCPEKGVLYLIASPGYRDKFYAVTNHNEIAAIGLDADGQPTRLLRALRTPLTGRDSPMGLVCDPATRRLYLNCYSQFGWCTLDDQGLPMPDRFQSIAAMANFWDWVLVSGWHRCFGMPGGSSVSVCQLEADGRNVGVCQGVAFPSDGYIAGHVPRHNIEVSARFRKLYVLRFRSSPELIVCSLTTEGRLTGLPRYFELGEARAIRLNFKAGLLHAFAHDWMKTFALDGDGHPTVTPSQRTLSCGQIRDVIVDEATGKVYVACSQPPMGK